MSIFKKELTPQDRYDKANKRLEKLDKKIKKLKRNRYITPNYQGKLDDLTASRDSTQKSLAMAEYEIKHPKPVPQYLDNSKRVTVKNDIAIGSNNKASVEAHGHYHKEKKETGEATTRKNTSTADKKQNKKKNWNRTLFIISCSILVVAITILACIVSYYVNCNSSKSTSSTYIENTI